jgi:DNA-binding SARP family transcriptional activator
MQFRILGPLEVLEDARPVQLSAGKERVALLVLLLNANEVVSSDRLIDALWGEHPPPSAAKLVQGFVSRLRQRLGEARVETHPLGYVFRLGEGELDLERFETLLSDAHGAPPAEAAALLREALSLWRGAPLPELAYGNVAQAEIARLEALRLAALEERIDAELSLGLHAELVPELERAVAREPLRERLRRQLMLALYRSGRQTEALLAYQSLRRLLVEEVGIDPSPALKELEHRILVHDPALDLERAPANGERPAAAASTEIPPVPERSVILVSDDAEQLAALVGLCEPLARAPVPRELILARLLAADRAPAGLTLALDELAHERAALAARGVSARVACFSSPDRGRDLVRLADRPEVDLLALELPGSVLQAGELGPDAAFLLERAPCEVALLVGREPDREPGGAEGPVLVPFGGTEHDWAALELGASLAAAGRRPLQLLGTVRDMAREGRDASRLLADAGLIVQRVLGVLPQAVLVRPGRAGIVAAAQPGGLLVVGLPDGSGQGLGQVRWAIARTAHVPVVFVRRGARPSPIDADESFSRHRWSGTRRPAERS